MNDSLYVVVMRKLREEMGLRAVNESPCVAKGIDAKLRITE